MDHNTGRELHVDIIRLLVATILRIEAGWIRDLKIDYNNYTITCLVGVAEYKFVAQGGHYVRKDTVAP